MFNLVQMSDEELIQLVKEIEKLIKKRHRVQHQDTISQLLLLAEDAGLEIKID